MERIILVTGGNRGIGYAIVKRLSEKLGHSSKILLGCRNLESGNEALRSLQQEGITGVDLIQLDVSSDADIRGTAETINQRFGFLDVLINNAGHAAISTEKDFSDLRTVLQEIYNVNVSSVAVLTRHMLPLLKRSQNGGKVIQIGSARGSIQKLANGELPPTVALGYSISKTALNALTLQMAIEPDNIDIEFQVACPGHCKTAFNGYKGTREPEEGANVVVELATGARRSTNSWETQNTSLNLVEVPW